MSSGEWDLRALKALEEEEQKEFLALSQKNLFEPPSPPTRGRLLQQTQQLKLQQQQPKLTYAQLHPHTLKLPTINEYNLILAARKRRLQQQDNPKIGAGRTHLKFTRALSLSANSLTTRSNGNRKNAFSNIKGKTSQTSDSTSLSHLYNVSPYYTPPPIKRCETFHHTKPTRKTVKSYQQFEKQKLYRKREGPMMLKQVVGKNESLWKYGLNSTAASIIGQRKKLHSSSAEAESNTSDELGSEGTLNNVTISDQSEPFPISYADCDDNATEAGSCTVPLTTDSVEMIRLMLSAATAAISTHPKSTSSYQSISKEADYLLNKRPLHIVSLMNTATTNGTVIRSMSNAALNSPPLSIAKINDDKNIRQTDYGSTHRTLSSRYPLELSASSFTPTEETVAYKTLREQRRNKSLSYNGLRSKHTIRRGNSLTDETSVNDSSSNCNSTKSNCPLAITTAAAKNLNFGEMYKTNSLNISTDLDNETANHILLRSTFLKNPIVQGVKVTATELKKGVSAQTRSTIDKIGIINAKSMKNKSSKHIQHLLLHTTQMSQPSRSSAFSREMTPLSNDSNCIKMNDLLENDKAKVSTFASLHQQLIDNELEHHIKHCSCSCNHMGYGNSMDYQVIKI
uniref:Uncharacterized protein n=1 Tax=Ceratitis capitata TaxID=7213 RepID=W8CBS5_CERCA